MTNVDRIKKQVLEGKVLEKKDIILLFKEDTFELAKAADEIRKTFCGNKFSICTIINGKSGRCSENCKYCAQSIYFKTNIEEYDLLSQDTIKNSAKSNYKQGVHKFSIVTSGKRMSAENIDNLCDIYKSIHSDIPIELCASHGLLGYEELKKLKEAGVIRYHNNLETSKNYFKNICTTHTFDEKIETIKNAKLAGLEVCSGGIIGLGETMEDRMDMAFTLRELEVNSVTINILNPIKGTPLENQTLLSYEEIIKTISLIRFILPKAEIRLAGGRALLLDKGLDALKSGINACISGDMLTTSGIKTEEDIEMIRKLGFEV